MNLAYLQLWKVLQTLFVARNYILREKLLQALQCSCKCDLIDDVFCSTH